MQNTSCKALQPQDVPSIVKLQGSRKLLSTLRALGVNSFVCRIGWEWFLSWVHELWEFFGTKKWKECVQKCACSIVFLGQRIWGKTMGLKRWMFTRQTDFALISTVFIHLGCNFTWSSTMDMIFLPKKYASNWIKK